ncbi:carbon-nitrogen hydrolase [Ceratobasidium sp. AG-Ba]|nr:carbon-nitrogen hydrolase [Ceratobasidium sp. AG-Ba]
MSDSTTSSLPRVGLVQFNPKIEDVQYNIQKVKELTADIEPGSVDLVCLPEMAFTGYVFPTAESILPFVEHPNASPTKDTCAELARRLRCHVIAGYPAPPLTIDESKQQAQDGTTPASHNAEDETAPSGQGVARNSALVVDPNGNVIHTYAKTNMFEADLPWAQPGSGFSTFTTSVESLGKVSVAICMDLNPHPPNVWASIEGPYEIADYCIENNVDTLVLLCAWLRSSYYDDSDAGQSFDSNTVNYWIARLRPLWHAGTDKYTVIICNRTGTERGWIVL